MQAVDLIKQREGNCLFVLACTELSLYLEDVKPEDYPQATRPNEVDLEGQQFVMMVAFDKLAYDRKYNAKSVKKTLSIPAWLNAMALEKNVNFSNVLQKALLAELGVM